MPDLTAIAAALSSLKAAKDIAEAMIGLRDTAAFQGKLLEFQSKLLDANNAAFAAQNECAAMLERIRELEKEVADLKAWETEKKRYELKDLCSASFAYAIKKDAKRAEPFHCICASCYERGKKSIIQIAIDQHRIPYLLLGCPECSSQIIVGQWPPDFVQEMPS